MSDQERRLPPHNRIPLTLRDLVWSCVIAGCLFITVIAIFHGIL